MQKSDEVPLNIILTVGPQPPSHARYNYSIITSSIQVLADPLSLTTTPCLPCSLIRLQTP